MHKTPFVEVLGKSVRLLEILAEAPGGLSLQGLTAASGFAKTTAHRLLQTWEELGYVSRVRSGKYQLGLTALELARKVSRRNRVVEASREMLVRLQQATAESAYLAVYRDGRVILIDGLEGSHPLRVVVDLGEQCYLHASAQGRSVAAFIDRESLAALLERDGLVKVTPDTKTDMRTLIERLNEVRTKGYSINWGETIAGAVCIGVPFFAGVDGAVLGSIGLSVPMPRATEMHIQRCLDLMLKAASQLSLVLVDVAPEPDARPAVYFAVAGMSRTFTQVASTPLPR